LKATATAHPNIALIKYWGKRHEKLILPHQSSLSVTLGPISVTTSVEFTAAKGPDEVSIGGRSASDTERARVVEILNLVRKEALLTKTKLGRAVMHSVGDFPKAAGLASSAAAFAALSLASRSAAGFARNTRAESILARRGSGSASRSIQGGFVRWNRGHKADGRDSFGEQLFTVAHWPTLRMLVGMVSEEEKETKSRDGMKNTVKTSPYYAAWVKAANAEVRSIVPHIRRRDLEAVGDMAEQNAWRMHATAFAASPPLSYLKPETVAVIEACRTFRKQGVGVWFTLDAGPNPVLLTTPADEKKVAQMMRGFGAKTVVHCAPGDDAKVQIV
jgi:diphosphomevalonate decarboxylase